MKRRKFLKKLITYSTIGAGITGLYSWQIEPNWLDYVQLNMPIKNLPENLLNNKLIQISDLHIGARVDDDFILNSLKRVEDRKPEFIVYTGDYITLNKGVFLQEKLQKIIDKMPLGTKGTVAILGNHDYGKRWQQPEVADKIVGMLQAKNIIVLRNEKITINGLNIIGIDDYWGTNFNPKLAMNNYEENKPFLVLCHNPDVCDLDVWNNYKGWILSGHTHGGQVRFPFTNPTVLPVKNKKYTYGKFQLNDDRILYINRALGHSLKIRFCVRPEITEFNLLQA